LSAKLISIIGPPAVGKTTLAELLSAALPAEFIREDYAGNPFLVAAYAGRSDAGLPSQLYFLMSRAGQLAGHTWPGDGVFVSDYGFCQDRLYARRSLRDDELSLYERIARRVEAIVHPPDVLVVLDAGEAVLLERIARRGRDYERAITEEFLAGMRAEYNRIAAGADRGIIRVDCEACDPRDEAVLAALTAEVRRRL